MVNLFVDGQLIDQYSDESVDINSSVLDVQDITKNTGDYSKEFSVPTSKRNNKVFKHWYNSSIDNGFDGRTRVKGSIDIDGVPFKTGKWLLRSVKMVKGVADSYKINFYGDTSSLSEIAGNDELKDLDLSALNHEYSGANVTTGLTEGLFGNSIIYTPLAQKRYFYSNTTGTNAVGDFPSGATEEDDTPKIEAYNIGYNSNVLGTGMLWTDLRPSIRLLDIIEAIENRYNGTFQKTIIAIENKGSTSGNIKLYLNGVEYTIFLGNSTETLVASQLSTAINGISGYSATQNNEFVTVLSETTGRETPTQIDNNTHAGLVTSIITTLGTKDHNLNFTRDFFGTTEFERAYMWLNSDLKPKAIGNSSQLINWTSKDSNNVQTNIATDTSTLFNLDGDAGTKWNITISVTPSDYTAQYSIRIIDNEETENGGLLGSSPIRAGDQTVNYTLKMDDYRTPPLNNYLTDRASISFEIVSTIPMSYVATLNLQYVDVDGDVSFTTNAAASLTSIFSGVECNKLMPEMKITDFLKSLFQMFKLVVTGDADNEFYVNTLDSYYAQGDYFDISRYVDLASFDVERGEIISELDFKFAEPTTQGGLQFLENTGSAYGDSKVKLRSSDGEDLDGDTLSVSLPYENVVYNRLTNYESGDRTDIQVGTILDADNNSVLNAPLIHYATLIDISETHSHIKFKGDSGTQRLDWDMWMPFSHFGVNEPMYSLMFDSEISTYTYSKVDNTLYSRHYKDYIDAIFNIKRRTIKVSAKLPIQIITRLTLNDVVSIDQLDYRINKYSYNLLTGITKLELINGFEQYNVTDLYIPEKMTIGLNAEDLYFNVPNVSNYSIYRLSVGSGTSWITTSIEGNEDNLIKIAIDEWIPTSGTGFRIPTTTNPYRYMKILLVNNTTSEQTYVLIAQTPNNLT
tara:strand:+ start:445 stop:3180 length:2736 start_codon:yes stop_codon:yes gene_type:complete